MSSFWCILLAVALVFLSKIPLANEMIKQKGHYDNRTPRKQANNLDEKGERALAAHQNTFESFPIFAASFISGHILGVEEGTLWVCGITFF